MSHTAKKKKRERDKNKQANKISSEHSGNVPILTDGETEAPRKGRDLPQVSKWQEVGFESGSFWHLSARQQRMPGRGLSTKMGDLKTDTLTRREKVTATQVRKGSASQGLRGKMKERGLPGSLKRCNDN